MSEITALVMSLQVFTHGDFTPPDNIQTLSLGNGITARLQSHTRFGGVTYAIFNKTGRQIPVRAGMLERGRSALRQAIKRRKTHGI